MDGMNPGDCRCVEGSPHEKVGKRVAGWPTPANPDVNAAVTHDLDFASQGSTQNIVGKSTGPHKAAYVLGKGRPD